MKTLGLIGAPWPSVTGRYWSEIHEGLRLRRKRHDSLRIILEALPAASFADLDARGPESASVASVVEVARRIEAQGAELIALCSAPLDAFATAVKSAVKVPVVRLTEAVTKKLVDLDRVRPAVIGMTSSEHDLWERAFTAVGIARWQRPGDYNRKWIQGKIGKARLPEAPFHKDTGGAFVGIVDGFRKSRANAVVLASPELNRWLSHEESPIMPVCAVETHAEAIVTAMLGTPLQTFL